jgi:PAS domain S-box-containing protein
MDETLLRLIGKIGVSVQLGGTALLLVLFYLLTRHAGVRSYFVRWAWGWFALLGALGVVVLRYFAVAALPPPGSLPAYVLHTLYLFGKLVHFELLLAGTWLFCRDRPLPGRPWLWLAGAGLFSGVAAFGAVDLNPVMAVQEPIAVAVYLVCAYRFANLPPVRRTMGTRFTVFSTAFLAVLWTLYGVAFWDVALGHPIGWLWLQQLAGSNSFVDTGAMVLLAYGQVVILLEDVRQEAEDARAERLRAVAASEARLKAVIETATDGIVAADGEGHVVLANAAAARLFGARRRDMAGRPLQEFFPESVRPELEQRFRDVRRATPGRQTLFEITGRSGWGEDVPLEVAASTLLGAEGELDILVLRDLSERRRVEAEREQLQARLEQSLRMEALGRLVSGVAHELNNPLAAILTFSEQLLAEESHRRMAGPLETIREQARRARAIVRDLLGFVRRREERREVADAAGLVERTVRALKADLARQEVRLTVSLERDLPPLTCDPAGIEQVLTNLLDNAARAARGGTVDLRVRRERDGLMIEVEDSGPGVPLNLLPRIFEPFFTTRGTGEGTGLGLSVSLGIVQQHGGYLKAENRTPGPGARFLAWLPFGAPPSAPARLPAPTPVAAATPGARVLIIDDEDAVRSSLRRYFERQNWVVEEASDGSVGLVKLEESRDDRRYDLVICDLKMPGLSGFEVHQWVKAHRPDLLARLVFASGDTASPDAAAFLTTSARPVLEKPFELSELAAIVARVQQEATSAI